MQVVEKVAEQKTDVAGLVKQMYQAEKRNDRAQKYVYESCQITTHVCKDQRLYYGNSFK